MESRRAIQFSLHFIFIISLLFLSACESNDNSAAFNQEEKIIMNLVSRSKLELAEAKKVADVFDQIIEKKDIQLLLPYRSKLERQYLKDKADLEKISELFSPVCLELLEEITESINRFQNDNCSYKPVGFLETPAEEKRFHYYLHLSRYHLRFTECSLKAYRNIVKSKKEK